MKKKILLGIVMLVGLFTLAGCSNDVKHSASAKLNVGENDSAVMTVDLTGGYSVEFASGAVYFYEGEPSDETYAHGFVITKEEYEEEYNYFEGKDDLEGEYKSLEDGGFYYKDDSSVEYFFPSEDGYYVKVVVNETDLSKANEIYTRFSASKVE